MDVREKLVELLNKANSACVGTDCFEGCKFYMENDCLYKLMADVMIENGVTVQEWISAKNRLPNEPMRCLVYTKRGEYCGYEITYYNQGFYTQYAEAIYWMPLPQPPKGETIYCKDCEHLMFSDCYGECANGHKGIVNPNDTCEHAKRKPPKGE